MEEINARLDKAFGKEAVARVDTALQTAPAPQGTPAIQAPIDVYQNRQDRAYRHRDDRYPHGSSRSVSLALKALLPDLQEKYRNYKDQMGYLKSRGETTRSDILRQQYLNETFLPVVEAIIMQSSPDELLNSKEALEALDGVSGAIANGFTAGYVSKAYNGIRGAQEGSSDGSVRDAVGRIRCLIDQGKNRAAVGLASDMKRGVDDGDYMASEADYALLSRVANFE